MAGVNNQRIEGVRKNRKHKEGPEIAMGEGVWVRNPKGHYGEGLAFLEFSTRGLRRDNPKSFLSLGRAIIVRNGEIIPMSREFTPETERQRLQQLVSRNPCSLLSLVLVCTLRPGTPPTPTTQMDSSLLEGVQG